MLLHLQLQQTTRPLEHIHYMDRGGQLDLSPPYQRGDVWGQSRQRSLLYSLLRGIPIPTIIVNDRFTAGWGNDAKTTVIDGKQRCTAILRFFYNRLSLPRDWLDPSWYAQPFNWLSYGDLTVGGQRHLKNMTLPFAEARLTTIEAEQEVYALVNYGGVPQGQRDTDL